MTDIREQEMQGKINELTAHKASLEAENKQLRKQVEWLRKAQFGRKSETKKVVYPEEQMSLFNEAETEKAKTQRTGTGNFGQKPHKRKKKVGHREELLANCLIRKLSSNQKPRSARNVASHFRRQAKNRFVRKSSHPSPCGSEGFLS